MSTKKEELHFMTPGSNNTFWVNFAQLVATHKGGAARIFYEHNVFKRYVIGQKWSDCKWYAIKTVPITGVFDSGDGPFDTAELAISYIRLVYGAK